MSDKKFDDMELGVDFKCEVCRYYYRRGDKPECRFNPPTVLMHKIGAPLSAWPNVNYYDWCGDFRPNEALVAKATEEAQGVIKEKVMEVIRDLQNNKEPN